MLRWMAIGLRRWYNRRCCGRYPPGRRPATVQEALMSYGVKLDPHPIAPGLSVRDLVDHHLYAYNAARLREACQLFARKIAEPDVTIGVTLSGALTPTGLGTAAIVPLIRAGLVDWVVSTGANLYHDMHRSLGFELWGTTPFVDDRDLRERKLIRIYDILFDQDVLLES